MNYPILLASYLLLVLLIAAFIYFRFFKKDRFKSNLALIFLFVIGTLYILMFDLYYGEYGNF